MQVDAVQDTGFPRGVRTLQFDGGSGPPGFCARQSVTMSSTATSQRALVPIQAPAGLQLVASGQNNQMALVPYSLDWIYLHVGVSKQVITK
jgi:hypothetical protein